MSIDEGKDWPEFFSRDRYAELAGIELLEACSGRAKAKLEIGEQHLNAFGVIHGGALFTLADLTFGAAANSHGSLSLVVQAEMQFMRAVSSGTLTATGREIRRGRTIGNYEVEIRDQTEQIIAVFHGIAFDKGKKIEC